MAHKPKLFPWVTIPPQMKDVVLPQNDGVVLPSGQLNFLTKDECDAILRFSEGAEEQEAITGDGASKISTLRRNSRVRTIYPEGGAGWIFDKFQNTIVKLMPHFKFEVTGFFEGAQLYHYPPGGFLDWHIDIGRGYMSTRKLSITVQLTDGSSYKGGDLEFMDSSQKSPKGLGTIIVFPSYLMHRVTQVTSGTRISLVSWVHGVPYH